MCPRPQAGSRHVIELRALLEMMTCSMRARVAQGGVGKSSRLFFSSALCAITACDVFCIMHSATCRLRSVSVLYGQIRSIVTMARFGNGPDKYQTVLNRGDYSSACRGRRTSSFPYTGSSTGKFDGFKSQQFQAFSGVELGRRTSPPIWKAKF